MDNRFDTCLAFTLHEEGGFLDNRADPRGATNLGITLARLRRFMREPNLGIDDIREIPHATVCAIYLADFWNRARCDALPDGIDLMVFDHAVNAGPDRAARALQMAAGQKRSAQDGAVGQATLAHVAEADPRGLLDALAETQRIGYRRMAAFGLFGDNWLARLNRRHAKSQDIARLVSAR